MPSERLARVVPTPAHRPIRIAILDDNPFVRSADGTVRPRAALFHRFADTVVARGGFAPAAYLVPVASAAIGEPGHDLDAVDERRLRVVATEPFDGIAGYLRHLPGIATRNWQVIRRAVADADLVWIKAPASNAPLAAIACRRARVPRFTWVAGSVRAVVGGQPRSGLGRLGAVAIASAYDAVTGFLERTGPAVRLDDDLFTSIVTASDIAATRAAVRPTTASGRLDGARPVHIAWAGRVVPDKGLDDLLAAVVRLKEGGVPVSATFVGDGPARAALATRAAELGLDGTVEWRGFVGDRTRYLDLLRDADVFVLPSRAEGVPKVLVEAMAAGVPVVATRVGRVAAVLGEGSRGRLVRAGSPGGLADAIADLARDPACRDRYREAGLAYATDHTIEAQADRLLDWLRRHLPGLAWDAETGP